VLIVSRGLDALLSRSLQALQVALDRAPVAASRVVVIDNGSDWPYAPGLLGGCAGEIVRVDVPTSFARANNLAAHRHPADMYLLLNNDVLLARDAIADMYRVMRDAPDAGICGTRLLFPDGTIQHCGVAFGGGPRGPYHKFRKAPAHRSPRADREWQAVTGACMLVRHAVWNDLGGFDERYPFGLEDIDLCLRARARGWRVYCCNTTDSLHFESMTPGRVALDVSSRRLFMLRWKGRYAVDG